MAKSSKEVIHPAAAAAGEAWMKKHGMKFHRNALQIGARGSSAPSTRKVGPSSTPKIAGKPAQTPSRGATLPPVAKGAPRGGQLSGSVALNQTLNPSVADARLNT